MDYSSAAPACGAAFIFCYMVKNLLFDLGGVVVDIDRQRCVDAYAALGLENPDSYFGL